MEMWIVLLLQTLAIGHTQRKIHFPGTRYLDIIEIFVAHSFCDSFTLFQMTSLWRARILPSVLACSSSGQSTWKEAASKTAHKWLPKLLTPALSICSHFLQQPEQNTGIDYYSHAMEKVYLLHIFYKRTKLLCRTIQISNIVLIYL